MTKRNLLPQASPRPTRLKVVPVDAVLGAPTKNIASMVRFTEADLSLGLKDDITNTYYTPGGSAPQDANNVQAIATNGGLLLTGLRNLPGPTIDYRNAFTIILGFSMLLPLASKSTGILATSSNSTRGLLVYDLSSSVAPRTTDLYNRYYLRTLNGTPQAPQQVPNPPANRYDRLNFLIVLNDGLGNYRIEDRVDNRRQYQSGTWAVDTLSGAGGSKVYFNQIVLGCLYSLGAMSATGAIMETLLVYNQAEEEQEIRTAMRAINDLVIGRGRG